jgi:membrane-associated phospholipid phosphatase
MIKRDRLLTALLAFMLFFSFTAVGQDQPFKLSSPGDYITGGILIPATFGAKSLYNHKSSLTVEKIQNLSINNINAFDRSAVHHYSYSSKKASDYLLFGSLVAPSFLFIDSKMRKDAGVKVVIYLETVALTATEVSLVKSLIDRARPFVYNPDVPMSEKLKPDANCSFFSGHTAMTASSTFFMASMATGVYGHRYDWTWFAAAVPPLLTGYFRYSAGRHFFTDILAGFIVGSFNGFIVSQLHKTTVD